MKCSVCGFEGVEGKFCSECGNPLFENQTFEEKEDNDGVPKSKLSNGKQALLAIVGVILLIIVAFAINNNSDSQGDKTDKIGESNYQDSIALIDSGKYEEALTLLKSIPSTSPYSGKAKDKINEIKPKLAELRLNKAKSLFTAKKYSEAFDEITLAYNTVEPPLPEIKQLLPLYQKEKEEQDKKSSEERNLKVSQALSRMRKNYDEVKEIEWYYDKSTPRYDNTNNFMLYIGKKKDLGIWLRFCIRFAAEDWLFIDKYIIKADNATFEIDPTYDEITRDNNYGGIWEVYDTMFTKKELEIVKAVIKSKKTILRCEGDTRVKDRVISQEEKAALQNILNAYEAMGGSLSTLSDS